MRLRVVHLANELGVSLKDIIRAADQALGLQIRSGNVSLKDDQIAAIRRNLGAIGGE